MLKSMRKHGITLALFAAGSTGLTAAINELTKSTIAEQAATQQKALFNQVLPADRYNNDLHTELLSGRCATARVKVSIRSGLPKITTPLSGW
ncbi:electron transport complex protein RnfG [Raoultella planticola]|uniref:Electron transport complex protein RnfG n=1 Tax=Raoultella planticola TaxID=575 RepID=A0A485CY83_RAOPL|nr:electron transport complex protein RnfG [Raoultella planticola]